MREIGVAGHDLVAQRETPRADNARVSGHCRGNGGCDVHRSHLLEQWPNASLLRGTSPLKPPAECACPGAPWNVPGLSSYWGRDPLVKRPVGCYARFIRGPRARTSDTPRGHAIFETSSPHPVRPMGFCPSAVRTRPRSGSATPPRHGRCGVARNPAHIVNGPGRRFYTCMRASLTRARERHR